MGQGITFGLAASLAFAHAIPASAQEDECNFRVGDDHSAILSPGCKGLLDAAADDAARANLLFRIGYALNERREAIAALPILEQAVGLDSSNAHYWQELGYTRADLGFYREALSDLDRSLTIDPEFALALDERGWVKQNLGDFEGANSDYDRYFAMIGDRPAGSQLSYAENLVWLGRLDQAEAALASVTTAEHADRVAEQRDLIARIRAYRRVTTPPYACELEDLSGKEEAARLFDACTAAFLVAGDSAARAEFLTYRAIARVVMENGYDRAVQDYKVVVGIDPDNPNSHLNYGFALLQIRRSWAARNSFDAVLALGADIEVKALALAGRAQANYNLDDKAAARADAIASFELSPNPVNSVLLGNLAIEDGEAELAKAMWMAAYGMGIRDDALLASLAEIGVTDPDNEPFPDDE